MRFVPVACKLKITLNSRYYTAFQYDDAKTRGWKSLIKANTGTWENFGVGKIGEFGELWDLRQYFTSQLFLFILFQLATINYNTKCSPFN